MRAPALTTAPASMKQGPSIDRAVFDAAPRRDDRVPARLARERRRLEAAVHDVAMGLRYFSGVPMSIQ